MYFTFVYFLKVHKKTSQAEGWIGFRLVDTVLTHKRSAARTHKSARIRTRVEQGSVPRPSGQGISWLGKMPQTGSCFGGLQCAYLYTHIAPINTDSSMLRSEIKKRLWMELWLKLLPPLPLYSVSAAHIHTCTRKMPTFLIRPLRVPVNATVCPR